MGFEEKENHIFIKHEKLYKISFVNTTFQVILFYISPKPIAQLLCEALLSLYGCMQHSKGLEVDPSFCDTDRIRKRFSSSSCVYLSTRPFVCLSTLACFLAFNVHTGLISWNSIYWHVFAQAWTLLKMVRIESITLSTISHIRLYFETFFCYGFQLKGEKELEKQHYYNTFVSLFARHGFM